MATKEVRKGDTITANLATALREAMEDKGDLEVGREVTAEETRVDLALEVINKPWEERRNNSKVG